MSENVQQHEVAEHRGPLHDKATHLFRSFTTCTLLMPQDSLMIAEQSEPQTLTNALQTRVNRTQGEALESGKVNIDIHIISCLFSTNNETSSTCEKPVFY